MGNGNTTGYIILRLNSEGDAIKGERVEMRGKPGIQRKRLVDHLNHFLKFSPKKYENQLRVLSKEKTSALSFTKYSWFSMATVRGWEHRVNG